MNKIIQKMTDKNNKAAYSYCKKIVAESKKSDKYLKMIPTFASMLQDDNSYVRTRFFILICCQSRWATKNQIKKVFSQMEPLLNDPKPTVVRQCLKALKEVILYRPEMCIIIKNAISKVDMNIYKGSMSTLIKKDIDELLLLIKKKEED